jgi:hypothetical protein
MLRIRNKIFGSGVGAGSGLKLVSDSDPDSNSDPDPWGGGGEGVVQPKMCIPPGKILGTPLTSAI